jgi:hypothetical protein
MVQELIIVESDRWQTSHESVANLESCALPYTVKIWRYGALTAGWTLPILVT